MRGRGVSLVEVMFSVAVAAIILMIIYSGMWFYMNLRVSKEASNLLSNMQGNIRTAMSSFISNTEYQRYYLDVLRASGEFHASCDRDCWQHASTDCDAVANLWDAVRCEFYSTLSADESWNYFDAYYRNMDIHISTSTHGGDTLGKESEGSYLVFDLKVTLARPSLLGERPWVTSYRMVTGF